MSILQYLADTFSSISHPVLKGRCILYICFAQNYCSFVWKDLGQKYWTLFKLSRNWRIAFICFFNLIGGVVFRSLSCIEDTVAPFSPNISCSAIHSINSEGDLILCLFSLLSDFRQIRKGISTNYTSSFWHFREFYEALKKRTTLCF